MAARSAASMSSQESKPPPEPLLPSGSAGAPRSETASSSLVRVGERGVIENKVTKRTRRIGTGRVNFVAKFVMDNGASTDLSLSAAEYDTSPSADYEAWLVKVWCTRGSDRSS